MSMTIFRQGLRAVGRGAMFVLWVGMVVVTPLAGGASVTQAAAALKGTLTAHIVPANVPNKSAATEVARIYVKGGVVGQTISPFKWGLKVVYEIHDSVLSEGEILRELYDTAIVVEGSSKVVGNPSATMANLGGGYYEMKYMMQPTAAYYVPRADFEYGYAVRYQPKDLVPGQAVTIHLLNGSGTFGAGKYSHFTASDGVDRLRELDGYQMTYDASSLAARTTVIAGELYTTTKQGIQQTYGINILDNDRLPLAAVQIVRNILDGIGRDIFSKQLIALRVNNGYTDSGTDTTGSLGIASYRSGTPTAFGEVLIHELHHNIDSHISGCLALDATKCKYLEGGALTKDGQMLASIKTRMKRIVARAGARAEDYLRTEITRRTYKATGSILVTPTVYNQWQVALNPRDTNNSIYVTKPLLTFTSGNFLGQTLTAGSFRNPILTMKPPGGFPLAGSTFTMVGDGSDFFVMYPEEFLASISNNWGTATQATWQRCLAAYRGGHPLVMDQCLLFADIHSFRKGAMPLFSQRLDGFINRSLTPVVKEHNRVVAVPSLGPQKFTFDAEGLVLPIGDLNGDKKIFSSDALSVLRLAVATSDGLAVAAADADCSGSVTPSDALLVLKAAVGTLPKPVTCNATRAAAVPKISVTSVGSGTGKIEPTMFTSVGSEVALGFKATPALGSRFVGWSGVCTGTGECKFTTSGLTTLSATARFDRTTVGAALGFLGAGSAEKGLLIGLLILCGAVSGYGFWVGRRRA